MRGTARALPLRRLRCGRTCAPRAPDVSQRQYPRWGRQAPAGAFHVLTRRAYSTRSQRRTGGSSPSLLGHSPGCGEAGERQPATEPSGASADPTLRSRVACRGRGALRAPRRGGSRPAAGSGPLSAPLLRVSGAERGSRLPSPEAPTRQAPSSATGIAEGVTRATSPTSRFKLGDPPAPAAASAARPPRPARPERPSVSESRGANLGRQGVGDPASTPSNPRPVRRAGACTAGATRAGRSEARGREARSRCAHKSLKFETAAKGRRARIRRRPRACSSARPGPCRRAPWASAA